MRITLGRDMHTAVYWDRTNYDTLEQIINAAVDQLEATRRMMKRHNGLDEKTFELLVELRREMAGRLTAYDKGVGLTDLQRENLLYLEGRASEMIEAVDDEWKAA